MCDVMKDAFQCRRLKRVCRVKSWNVGGWSPRKRIEACPLFRDGDVLTDIRIKRVCRVAGLSGGAVGQLEDITGVYKSLSQRY